MGDLVQEPTNTSNQEIQVNPAPPENAEPAIEEANAPANTNAQANAQDPEPAPENANAPTEANAEDAGAENQNDAQANAPKAENAENAENGNAQENQSASANKDTGKKQEEQKESEAAAGGKEAYAKRFEVLKRKLVTERKAAKEEREAASLDAGVEHTSMHKHLGRLDYASIGAAIAGGVGSGLVANGPLIGSMAVKAAGKDIGAVGSIAGKLSGDDGVQQFAKKAGVSASNFEKKSKEIDENGKDFKGWASMVGSSVSTMGSLFKMTSNSFRSAKRKDKNLKDVYTKRAISGALGAVSGAVGVTNSAASLGRLTGTRSTEMGSGTQKLAGGLDVLGGAASFGASILDWKANKQEQKERRKLAVQTGVYSAINKRNADRNLSSAREQLKALQAKKMDEMSDEEKAQLKAERMKRHTAKAQKYAMEQAEKMNELRASQIDTNKKGMIGSGISLLGKALSAVGYLFGGGGALNMIGSAVGALGTGIGLYGTAQGVINNSSVPFTKAKEKLVGKKTEIVDNYMNEKMPRVKEQAKAMQLTDDEKADLGEKGTEITDTEARKIISMRLGNNEKADESDVKSVDLFEKLTEKRANNILKSDPEEKKQMLNALGLEEDARVEDVMQVLMAT